MSSSFIVLTPPSQEPVSLTEVKDWLNIDFPDKDTLLAYLITRARRYCETVTHRAFATQTIQQVYTVERPSGGELSGPINRGPDWYAYQQMIGANPFGAAQFYLDLVMPPFQSGQTYTIETKVTAFDTWKTFPQVTNPDGSTNTYVDNVQEPARLFFMDPLTVNFWRMTYTTGYWSGYSLDTMAPDLKQCLFELIAAWYDNREGEGDISDVTSRLLARRVDWV